MSNVDTIEALTQWDFFRDLDDATEQKLEASSSTQGWRLAQVATLPGRYAHYKK